MSQNSEIKANSYVRKDNGIDAELTAGSGQGGINYVTNPDAETSANFWNTYADAAGTSPVDGTGGSPNVTFTRTTVVGEVLRGNGSFKFSKDAANRQGEGVSTDIVIDLQDNEQSKRIFFSFDYKTSTNYVSDDVQLFIYDIDGTSVLTVLDLNNNNGGLFKADDGGTITGWFYSTPGNSNYRPILHVSSTNASAYDIFIDNVRVGPDSVVPGAIVQDLGTETWTINNTTASTNQVDLTRIGNRLFVTGKTVLSSAVSGQITWTIPAAYTAKISSYDISQSPHPIGVLRLVDTGTTVFDGYIQLSGANTIGTVAEQAGGTYIAPIGTTATVPHTWASGDILTWQASFIVSDWASGASISSSEVSLMTAAMRASGDAASASSGNPIIFPTRDYDTHAGYSVSTGLYTVPKTGRYRIHGFVGSANAAIGVFGYLAGSLQVQVGQTDSNGECAFSGTVTASKGQTISLRPNGTLDITSGWLNIEEIPDFTIFSAYMEKADVELHLDTGNGHGSTNNKIRRYTAARKSTGNGQYYTYTDSVANGMSVTIHIPGVYDVYVSDVLSTNVANIGITVNATLLTTSSSTLSYADGLRFDVNSPAANLRGNCGGSIRLNAGDVVRAHDDGTPNGTGATTMFRLVRIGP